MAPDDFSFLARLVHRRAGIVLGESRAALIERRLAPVMRRFGFKELAQVMRELRLGREALAGAVTEAMTVNETSFFRDAGLFRRLGREILPALLEARKREKRLRIWSAACAAGQEAYSIAMILDSLGLVAEGWSIDLIATDISSGSHRPCRTWPLQFLRSTARSQRWRSVGLVSAPAGRSSPWPSISAAW